MDVGIQDFSDRLSTATQLTHQAVLVPRDEGERPREVGDLAGDLDPRAVPHVQLARAARQEHGGL